VAVFPKVPLYTRELKSLTELVWVFVTLSHPRLPGGPRSSPDSKGILTQDLRPPIADGVWDGETVGDYGRGRSHTWAERDNVSFQAGAGPRTIVLVQRHEFDPRTASASGQRGDLIGRSRRRARGTVLSDFKAEPCVQEIQPALPAVASQVNEGRQ
jgi:hypothetical protein